MEKLLFSWNLVISLLLLSTNNAVKVPRAQRNIMFEDFLDQKLVKDGSVEGMFKTSGLNSCALHCSKQAHCLSFNFCSQHLCQLNSFEVSSKDVFVHADSNCVYRGMQREIGPKCKDRGEEKDIQDDAAPGVCGINFKRQDATLEEKWLELVEINTNDEWKRIESRICHLGRF